MTTTIRKKKLYYTVYDLREFVSFLMFSFFKGFYIELGKRFFVIIDLHPILTPCLRSIRVLYER